MPLHIYILSFSPPCVQLILILLFRLLKLLKTVPFGKVLSYTKVEKMVSQTLRYMTLSPNCNMANLIYIYACTHIPVTFPIPDILSFVCISKWYGFFSPNITSIGGYFNKDCYSRLGVWVWASYLISLNLKLLIRWHWLPFRSFLKIGVT